MKIYIDWLQCFCRGQISVPPAYSLCSTGIRSRTFAVIEEIKLFDKSIGFLCSKPQSSILPPDSYMLKFSNEILYSPTFSKTYDLFINRSGITMHNISRIDICTDFNHFDFFRDPENLIKDFFCEKIIYSRHSIFKIIGDTNHGLTRDYLRFGSNLSTLSVYLYRKSLEMKQKVFKSYIADLWKKNGLNLNLPIWRLEFSLKGGAHNIVDNSTGEIIPLNTHIFFNQSRLHDFFISLVSKYFKFVYANNSIPIKKLKQLKLFNTDFCPYEHFYLTKSQDLTRGDRIFIKRLENLNHEIRESNPELADHVVELSDFFSSIKGLSEYRRFVSSVV